MGVGKLCSRQSWGNMSKAILVCPRRADAHAQHLQKRITQLNERLTPDNLEPRSPYVCEHAGITAAILNPNETALTHRTSFALGKLIAPHEDWWRPGAATPEGTYALFRSDAERVELVSDVLASRTIWYAQTETLFLAATSQRAIAACLGSFEANASALPWMISAGHLGYGNAWDRRIHPLEGDARLSLDRATWRLSVARTPVTFQPTALPYEEHKAQLNRALCEVFSDVNLDYSKWTLPLSGGYDSRAILMKLDRAGLQTLTWGVKRALGDRRSDAYVAQKLAQHYRVEHRYFETDSTEEPLERVFNRYLVAGEGRIDHISGYMDGFRLWQRLSHEGIAGILRGDEAFGCRQVATVREIRHSLGLQLLSDFRPLEAAQDLPAQALPETLERRAEETSESWRDRLYHEVRAPVMAAALSDLKSPYVEIFNPLLTGKLVRQVRALPDHLRTNKQLFRDIVAQEGPAIAFAAREATRDRGDILKDKGVVNLLVATLEAHRAGGSLPDDFVRYLIENTKPAPPKTVKHFSKQQLKTLYPYLPAKLRSLGRRAVQKDVIDVNTVAFRAFLIVKMHEMLAADAALFSD